MYRLLLPMKAFLKVSVPRGTGPDIAPDILQFGLHRPCYILSKSIQIVPHAVFFLGYERSALGRMRREEGK